MALKKISIEDLPAFGGRLMELARKENIGTPALLAAALYEKYRALIEPAQRKNKNGKIVKDQAHDLAAITRMVQNHFGAEEAYEVQSKYLYAYSMLFGCSMDYLYGRTEVKSCNLELREICKKLHISEQMVNNFMNDDDTNPEAFSNAAWWSRLLSGNGFEEIPMAWLQYSMELEIRSDLRKKIEAIRCAEKSASDDTYRTMMEVKRLALEKMVPWEETRSNGAFLFLSKLLTEYIENSAELWVKSRHCDLKDNYYDNELRKIEILNSALKDGANPVQK